MRAGTKYNPTFVSFLSEVIKQAMQDSPPIRYSWLFLALILIAGGCQQQATSKLLGSWVGQPDTAEARRAREAEKYGDSNSEEPAESVLNQEAPETDWEQYEIETKWDFLSRTSLHMTLAGDPREIKGKWRVAQTFPTGCVIEVESSGEDQVEEAPSLRRFVIEFDEREGVVVGFSLYEEGADRQLGSLYFTRPDAKPKQADTSEQKREPN